MSLPINHNSGSASSIVHSNDAAGVNDMVELNKRGLVDMKHDGSPRGVDRSQHLSEQNLQPFLQRPILFSAPMVRAILEGRKTQTRRVLKPQPTEFVAQGGAVHWAGKMPDGSLHDVECDALRKFSDTCPYGKPGDRLWVRETWSAWRYVSHECDDWETMTREERGGRSITEYLNWFPDTRFVYRATDNCEGPWIPGIHMPRKAARITLEITDVRVERLQGISNEDAHAEGCPGGAHIEGYSERNPADPYEEFGLLWDKINGDGAWNSNPWVWAVSFRRTEVR